MLSSLDVEMLERRRCAAPILGILFDLCLFSDRGSFRGESVAMTICSVYVRRALILL